MAKTDDQVRLDLRDQKWRIEGLEFAYDKAVGRLVFLTQVLRFLSMGVSIAFVYVSYYFLYAGGDKSSLGFKVVSISGSALSLFLLIGSLWSFFFNWESQIEKKGELSRKGRALVGLYKRAMDCSPLDHSLIENCEVILDEFEQLRKHKHSGLLQADLRAGFQHLGKTYPGQGVTCNVCGKVWTHTSAGIVKGLFRFGSCENCGV